MPDVLLLAPRVDVVLRTARVVKFRNCIENCHCTLEFRWWGDLVCESTQKELERNHVTRPLQSNPDSLSSKTGGPDIPETLLWVK